VAAAPISGGRRPQRPWREWSAPRFEVRADTVIAAGIDGEAEILQPPLRFALRPGVLRVRASRVRIQGPHPRSSAMPDSMRTTPYALLAIAKGRRPA
jgi:hypothetical protein